MPLASSSYRWFPTWLPCLGSVVGLDVPGDMCTWIGAAAPTPASVLPFQCCRNAFLKVQLHQYGLHSDNHPAALLRCCSLLQRYLVAKTNGDGEDTPPSAQAQAQRVTRPRPSTAGEQAGRTDMPWQPAGCWQGHCWQGGVGVSVAAAWAGGASAARQLGVALADGGRVASLGCGMGMSSWSCIITSTTNTPRSTSSWCLWPSRPSVHRHHQPPSPSGWEGLIDMLHGHT